MVVLVIVLKINNRKRVTPGGLIDASARCAPRRALLPQLS